MRDTLERLLSQAEGRSIEINAFTRAPSEFVTLFPAEVLDVTRTDGATTKVFLKQLGPEQSDHPEKQRRDRELLVYDELLRPPGLPVAKFYGSRWNSSDSRYELFLEYIDDWSLKYHELEHWFEAARRLGELHAYFATRRERLTRCDFLLPLDARYFQDWAERALVAIANHSAILAAELRPVVGRYRPVASLLASQPPTLVHNDLAPKNVIADRSTIPARICFVDWEMAGIGCGLLDLVDLKYGLDAESDARMYGEYAAAIDAHGLLPATPNDGARLVAACELHKTLYRLAFGRTWGVPSERLAEWIAEARQLRARI